MPDLVDPRQRIGDRGIRMRADLDTRDITPALDTADVDAAVPVNDAALTGLKFSAAIPDDLARRTLAERLADQGAARHALADRRIVLHSS